MSRYIDADKLIQHLEDEIEGCEPPFGGRANGKSIAYGTALGLKSAISFANTLPAADVVEVRHDFNVGDFCLYGFADGNKSLAIVEIVKILDDERGIAELKFHKVIKDNTGNGYFHYLFKSGHTMNGSFEYLKNITPKVDGERSEVCSSN